MRMPKTPKRIGELYNLMRDMSQYFKDKEVIAREEFGWDSEQAHAEHAKWDALIKARTVIVKEFDL